MKKYSLYYTLVFRKYLPILVIEYVTSTVFVDERIPEGKEIWSFIVDFIDARSLKEIAFGSYLSAKFLNSLVKYNNLYKSNGMFNHYVNIKSRNIV